MNEIHICDFRPYMYTGTNSSRRNSSNNNYACITIVQRLFCIRFYDFSLHPIVSLNHHERTNQKKNQPHPTRKLITIRLQALLSGWSRHWSL